MIQKIRQDCSKEFVEFERCLRENQDKPTSCSPHVARFVACAETVDISEVGKSLLEMAIHSSRSHINSLVLGIFTMSDTKTLKKTHRLTCLQNGSNTAPSLRGVTQSTYQ